LFIFTRELWLLIFRSLLIKISGAATGVAA